MILTRRFFFLIIMTAYSICCDSGSYSVRTSRNVENKTSIENVEVNSQIKTSADGKVYILEKGWAIPNINDAKITTFERELRKQDNTVLKITVDRIVLNSPLISDEPFSLIDFGFKKIKIIEVKRFAFRGRVFCYRFQFVTVLNTNESGGALSFFSYYDEDGDGKFESLFLNEVDKYGFSTFSNSPHIPMWVN